MISVLHELMQFPNAMKFLENFCKLSTSTERIINGISLGEIN